MPDYRKLLEPYVAGNEGSDGEQRIRCPLPDHGDGEASASVNWQKQVWHCMGCGGGGSLRALAREMPKGSAPPGTDELAAKRRQKAGVTEPQPPEIISETKQDRYRRYLHNHPELLAYLTEKRGLTLLTISSFEIGYDEMRRRYTLPVRTLDGKLVNWRRYRQDGKPKMKNAFGHGSPPRLYPEENLQYDTVVVCEGEWDALLLSQHGFPAVTGTHGASTWEPEWSKQLAGKDVSVVYDCDQEGRTGAKKAARSLVKKARSVRIVRLGLEEEHGDVTDWFRDHAGTAEGFSRLLDGAENVQAQGDGSTGDDSGQQGAEHSGVATPVPVAVVGSMDSSTNGKPLAMTVTITGKRNPTYSVPHKVETSCTLDAGPKCKTCPMMLDHEGDYTLVIDPGDIRTVAKFIDANEARTDRMLREAVGVPPKCSRFETREVDNQSVEELFVTGSIDKRTSETEADYTQRRIYNVGGWDTKTNMPALVTGTTTPNPKDRRNEFFSWRLDESVTSIDKVEVTRDMVERLKLFRPKRGQAPIAKAREIATALADNVTGIVGRERLHMAMDLVYHSVLHFPLDGKVITRGWLEFLVVGDTRTGKSETAQHLAEHYGLGHVIGCEGSTFAGLVGAVKQIGDAWTITWGEITINDRRLVVLDEVSGLSQDIIGQLSDIRSRGMAQLTKAESQQTRARCRMIWISNPRRSQYNDTKYDGIDVIEDLIGTPEDIARFDFAMSVSMRDVDTSLINNPHRDKVPNPYTSELCKELVLWAWSRKSDDVVWQKDAYESIYKAAEWMGGKYVDQPPLIQRTNVREKLARLAVALAARTFSSDSTGTKLIVKLEHVRDAMRFLDELYGYENFGYRRISDRALANARKARRNKKVIKEWLLGEGRQRLLEFLLDRRGSFRSQDLEEMANMQRDEVAYSLTRLTDAKMISKNKSQIVVEPTLHELLREIEKERK